MITPDALIEVLVSHPDYASGKRRPLREVTADEAIAVTEVLHATMDRAAEQRAAYAAEVGRPLACHAGCSYCCEELVMVFRPEVLRVVRWLEQPEHAEVKEAFLAAYPAWKAKVNDAPKRMADVFSTGDNKKHLAVHIAQWKKRILCAFNRDGMCSIYDVRPLLCRDAHAVDTPRYCNADEPGSQAPKRLKSEELDEFTTHARLALRAAHHALGGPRMRPSALCEAVYQALTKP